MCRKGIAEQTLANPQVTVRENHSETAAREDEPKSSTSQPAT
jgi:hypothetical protein